VEFGLLMADSWLFVLRSSLEEEFHVEIWGSV